MTLSFMLGCLWVITANISAMIPSSDNYWRRAYILLTVGIPLLGYITYENGPIFGLIFLAAGASMLRWPIIYLVRWIKRNLAKTADK